MRLSSFVPAILGCAVLAWSQPAAAASSCPGGGTPTNCHAHCTLTNPPQCTEQCSCAITGNKVTGVRATAAARRRNGTQGPVQVNHPVTVNSMSRHGGGGGRH